MFIYHRAVHLAVLLLLSVLPVASHAQQMCDGPELEEFEFCALDAMDACAMDFPSCSSDDITTSWLVDSMEDGFYSNCCEKNGSENSKISCLKNALRKLKKLRLFQADIATEISDRVEEMIDNLKEFESCDAPDDETPPEDEDPGEGEDDEF